MENRQENFLIRSQATRSVYLDCHIAFFLTPRRVLELTKMVCGPEYNCGGDLAMMLEVVYMDVNRISLLVDAAKIRPI